MTVHLLGDSTLDNRYWIRDADTDLLDGTNCVVGILEDIHGYEVNDLAYDGFTTKDVLAETPGKAVGSVLPCPRNEYQQVKANGSNSLYVKPLEMLQTNIQKEPDKDHYVVISVGGNDFRENLSNPFKFIGDISGIQKRHIQIIEKVKSLGNNVKPIVMMQYRTDYNNDNYQIYSIVLKTIAIAAIVALVLGPALIASSLVALTGIVGIVAAPILIGLGVLAIFFSVSFFPPSSIVELLKGKEMSMLMFGNLLQNFYKPLLKYAKENFIDLLDLPNTMNPRKPLYLSGIEPNKEGGALIAKGIDHIIKNYEDNKGKLYSTNLSNDNAFVARDIDPKNYRVIYPERTI